MRPILFAFACSTLFACAEPSPFCDEQPPPCTFEPWDYGCPDGAERPCATTEPHVEGRHVESFESPLDGARRVYFVTGFSIPQNPSSSDDPAPGFDLDGLDSGEGSTRVDATCQEFNPDYRALDDPRHVGVDNALSGLVGTAEGLTNAADCVGGTTVGCVDNHLALSIERGDLGLAIVVSGLDDLAADPEVVVALHEATRMGDPGSTDAPIRLGRRLAEPAEGSVFAGRLRVRVGSVEIPFPRTGNIPFPPDRHRRAELRFDLDAVGPRSAVIGASISVDDFIASLEEDVGLAGFDDTLRSVVESVADLAPTEADSQICSRMSVGYALEVVEATEE